MAKQKRKAADPAHYRVALERTVQASDFSAHATRRALDRTVHDCELPANQPSSPAAPKRDSEGTLLETTDLTTLGDTTVLPPDLVPDPPPDGSRYQVTGTLGKGATARVYAVRDHALNRTVAVKLLHRRNEEMSGVKTRFFREARTGAMLEHPGIVPVYDVGTTGKQQVYFSMRNVSGCSLGEAIRSFCDGGDVPSDFATVDGRVRVFLKLCDALAYAHSRGFIHQDIKPDNVMLGRFGEVLLLDWGSSTNRTESPGGQGAGLFGTPAYMSPEQARRERADERSDIYCLGATLFHALFMRHPTWADEPEEFWEKKRAGALDLPTSGERRTMPKSLVAITLKALEPDPNQRYQSIEELASDLKRYHAGESVSAYTENPLEAAQRWYRHNRRVFWIGVIAAAAITTAVGVIFRQRILERLTWRLVYSEDFTDVGSSELPRRWDAFISRDWEKVSPASLGDSSAWTVENGKLHGRNHVGAFNNLTFGTPVKGDIRVEWSARALRRPGDLNCYLGPDRQSGLTFHVGGFDNPRRFALTKGRAQHMLDMVDHTFAIERNTVYRFRMEREGRHVRFFVNGTIVIDYVDAGAGTAPSGTLFGFEVNKGNHIVLDDIRVYHHPLPRRITPVAAVDQYYRDGLYARALEKYRQLTRTWSEREVAEPALFRQATCLLHLDSLQQAQHIFYTFEKRYPRSELVPNSMAERASIAMARGDSTEARAIYDRMVEHYPDHPALRAAFFRLTQDARTALNRQVIDTDNNGIPDTAYIDWLMNQTRGLQQWAQTLAVPHSGNAFLQAACDRLHAHGGLPAERLSEIFPAQRLRVADHLLDEGNYELVLSDYHDRADKCAEALLRMGRFGELLHKYPEHRSACADALLALGRYNEVLESYSDRPLRCARALRLAGRLEECLSRYPDQTEETVRAAAAQGTLPTWLRRNTNDLDMAAMALIYYCGKPDTVLRILARVPGNRVRAGTGWRAQALTMLGRTSDVESLVSPFSPRIRVELATAWIRNDQPERILQSLPFDPDQCARAHIHRGEFDTVLTKYPYLHRRCIEALGRAGRHEEILRRYPSRRNARAAALLALGRYDEVIAEFSDQRASYAGALLCSGKYDRVLQECSDQRRSCFRALLRLGRSNEARSRYPEFREEWAEYLVGNGRFSEVAAEFSDAPASYAMALVALGREEDLPVNRGTYRPGRVDRSQVAAWWALREYRQGKHERLDSLVAEAKLAPPGVASARFGRYLLQPVMAGLRYGTAALHRALTGIREKHRYTHGQKLWYETGLLSDALSERDFLAQPCKEALAPRRDFVAALREDIAGNRETALRLYESVADVPDHRRGDLLSSSAVRELIAWRVALLRESPAESSAASERP